jgi:hypothetical protein
MSRRGSSLSGCDVLRVNLTSMSESAPVNVMCCAADGVRKTPRTESMCWVKMDQLICVWQART